MIATAPFQKTSTPTIFKFPSLLEREMSGDRQMTLVDFYRGVLLPELTDLKPRSINEDWNALRHWERQTGNPTLEMLSDPVFANECLEQLIDGMRSTCAETTINKTWRELRAIFQAATEEDLCDQVPVLLRRRKGRRISSRLIKEAPKVQREIVTEAELASLWEACLNATYPEKQQFPASMYWRVAIVLFWTYGARTIDFLQNLTWDHVLFNDRLLKFTAAKTTKLQGLPLTDVALQHLKSIRGFSHRVFPGFTTPGCFLKKENRWKRGFRTTWRQEICGNAELNSQVCLKHFRERVLTTYNAKHAGLGSWILAHYMPGVSAQNYDLPSDQIREQICSAPVPSFFHEVG